MESRDTKGMVRIIWVDCAGIRRCRVVRRSRLLQAERFGIGLGFACHFLPCWGDVPPPDPVAAPVGEMRLMPDVSTMKSLPWRPNDAMVLVTMNNEPGEPWECCPRSALANAQDLLKKKLGVCLAVGFELEFVLMKKDASSIGAPQPIDQTVYCATSAFEGAADVLQNICDGLEAIGQIVEQVHAESAPGQFEIVLQYKTAEKAADDLIYAKETICAVANQHGMTASFLPKLLADQAGNGCHCHFSLVDNSGNNATSDSERRFSLSAMGEAFAAGIVAHLPSIMPFAAANPNSYHRIAPSTWSGAYHCWGVNNREAPCRLVGLAGRPDTVNFELKAMDGTANPHLCLVALIAAGLRGVREGMLLPETVQVDPATLPAEKRPQRLPPTLGESLRLLDCDTEFKAAFAEAAHSDVLLRVYAAVKCSECDVLEGMSLPEQVERLSARF